MTDTMRSLLRRLFTPTFALTFGACASAPAEAPVDAPSDVMIEHPRTGEEADDSIAGYPFTRQQLHDAFVVGTRINLRIEEHGEVHFEDLDVVAADDSGCTIATRVVTEAGDLIADKGTQTRTWAEIQADESHPRAETVIGQGKLQSFIGETDTWLYVYTATDAQGHALQSFHHYAQKLPGPPVLETDTIDGQVVKRTIMIGRR